MNKSGSRKVKRFWLEVSEDKLEAAKTAGHLEGLGVSTWKQGATKKMFPRVNAKRQNT